MICIGIRGKFQSGKDSIAARLVERWRFKRVSIGDEIRREVEAQYPLVMAALHDMQPCREHTDACLLSDGADAKACVKRMLYETKPAGFREFLQDHGSMRRKEKDLYWIERMWDGAAGLDVVVQSDVRDPIEAEMILELGGQLWQVVRPGCNGDGHWTETLMDKWDRWDAVIHNDESIPALWEKVDLLARGMGLEPAAVPAEVRI